MIQLAVENESGEDISAFDHRPCGEDGWTSVLGGSEVVPDGESAISEPLLPDCYDRRIEATSGCSSVSSTLIRVSAGTTNTLLFVGCDAA